jgi:hypothetical protein
MTSDSVIVSVLFLILFIMAYDWILLEILMHHNFSSLFYSEIIVPSSHKNFTGMPDQFLYPYKEDLSF